MGSVYCELDSLVGQRGSVLGLEAGHHTADYIRSIIKCERAIRESDHMGVSLAATPLPRVPSLKLGLKALCVCLRALGAQVRRRQLPPGLRCVASSIFPSVRCDRDSPLTGRGRPTRAPGLSLSRGRPIRLE